MAMRNEYMETTLPTWLGYFEKIAPRRDISANELHYASDRVTWVDFLVFNLLETNYNFEEITRPDGAAAVNILEQFKKLESFYLEFQNRPHLHEYLTSPERFAYKLPYPLKNAS